jgi:ADP-ribose pyrophosphatase YjhB (NUDIX family)
MPDYHESYLGKLRALVDKERLIAPGARAIIQDDEKRVLLVQRRDNSKWVMPAGSMELDESILETCRREVREETGLLVESATLIAIYSHPRYGFVTSYGDPYQMLAFVFRVDAWSGTLQTRTDETRAAEFFALDNLPDDIVPLYRETLDDLQRFNGTVILK